MQEIGSHVLDDARDLRNMMIGVVNDGLVRTNGCVDAVGVWVVCDRVMIIARVTYVK